MRSEPRISTINGVEKSQTRKVMVVVSVFWAARITTATANTSPMMSPQNMPVPTNTRSAEASS